MTVEWAAGDRAQVSLPGEPLVIKAKITDVLEHGHAPNPHRRIVVELDRADARSAGFNYDFTIMRVAPFVLTQVGMPPAEPETPGDPRVER